jgi:lysophospholipase L1-like esterase
MRLGVFAALVVVGLMLLGCGGSADQEASSDRPTATFIGSSQTMEWNIAASFPGKNYVRKARSGDTSTTMLARFAADVIAERPRVVVIWAGENDVEHGVPLEQFQNNIRAMQQQAEAAGIRVVLCTSPPRAGASAIQNPTIVTFNDWLRVHAATSGAQLADFYSVLVDNATGEIKPEFARNEEHLTEAAYAAISPIAELAITAALR